MSVKLTLDGFDELIGELTRAPQEMRAEGMGIVREETEGAAAEIRNQYHTKTGTLAKRVETEYPSTQVLVGIVRSRAPHAHLYEFGTQKRQTNSGANRGTMPAALPAVTVPIARRRRLRMIRRLADMLTRKGFEVSGV